MTIRHLRIFTAVAREGSMNRAAARLYLSQPTVSKAVKELEDYYGVRLFERLSQRLYITGEGELLLSYARQVLDSFDRMERALRSPDRPQELRIGCSVTVGTSLINPILDQAAPALRDCQVMVEVNNTSAIEEMVLSNRVDLGLVEGLTRHPDLLRTPVLTDRLCLVCAPDHPLARRGPLKLEDLEGQPLLSREHGSVDRNQVEQLFRQRGIQLTRSWNCTNTEAIKNGAAAGRGIAVLSSLMIRRELERGELTVLQVEGLPILRPIELILHRHKYRTPAMEEFIRACRERGQEPLGTE